MLQRVKLANKKKKSKPLTGRYMPCSMYHEQYQYCSITSTLMLLVPMKKKKKRKNTKLSQSHIRHVLFNSFTKVSQYTFIHAHCICLCTSTPSNKKKQKKRHKHTREYYSYRHSSDVVVTIFSSLIQTTFFPRLKSKLR